MDTGRFRETVVRFGAGEHLTGILTHPAHPLEEPAMPVLILGAGILHKIGPSRVSVDLARRLAARGHPCVRFDLSGIGDSRKSDIASLADAVVADIRSAVDILDDATGSGGAVAAVGFCSGADNAFRVADFDPRIRGVGMFDPTIHPTMQFHQRKAMQRITSGQSWKNVLSGRSLRLRATGMFDNGSAPTPEYYGLLSTKPEETDDLAGRLVDAGVQLLYVLSRGAHEYCNSPRQVRENIPSAYREDHVVVEWRPDWDHVFTRPEQRGEFAALLLEWLKRVSRPSS